MNGKMKKIGIVRVSVYFGMAELTAIAQDAEKAGLRRVGIPVRIQKPNGFADEWLANTDGIGRFLKQTYEYYKRHEADRLFEASKLAEARAQLEEKEKELASTGLSGLIRKKSSKEGGL